MAVQVHRPEGVDVIKKGCWLIVVLCFWAAHALGQELPEDALQLDMNSYFDNFEVTILYPSISLSKRVGETTSLSGRYLVDAISAASIKSKFNVDGVTSATTNAHGNGEGGIDELRHEVGLGVTRLLSLATISVNGLYSTEHDYTSRTIAAQFAYPFAKKNTTLQLGLVRSWDTVSPQTRFWSKDKNVLTLSGGLTQILSKKLLAQIDISYAENDGFLSDAYQVVTVIEDGTVRTFEPVHPGHRVRKAVGLRTNYKVAPNASLQLGYRYYWDDWDVRSHTVHTLYQHRLSSAVRLGLGVRTYFQSQASFFKPTYIHPEPFMTVDSKLNEGYSTELQLQTHLEGGSLHQVPVLGLLFHEKMELSTRFNFYFRHTRTEDWHSRLKNLYAYIFSIGYRYKL